MTLQVDGILDIETEDWDKFALGGYLTSDGVYQSYSHMREDEFIQHLLHQGGHVWTWNGGLYDTLWFLDKTRKLGLRANCAMAGSRIVRAECEGLHFHDAFALVPMSLQKAARIAGIELDKQTGLPCICGQNCGGYCSIRRTMTPAAWGALDAYLEKDCRATLAVIKAVIAESERVGYQLGSTCGSTSYRTAAKVCGISPAEWPDWRSYHFARRAYKGGRVEVFRPESDAGWSWDINSAYPAALAELALPAGDMVGPIVGARAEMAWKRERPGIYQAEVEVPDQHIPPLPARTPAGRVVFPTGRFRGIWPANELRYAAELGVKVAIERALVWSDERNIFAPFVEMGWKAREDAQSAGNDSLDKWHKWILNSCTGKLAEDPEKERIVICPRDKEVRACTCEAKTLPRRQASKECRCRPWTPIDDEGEVWSVPFWRLGSSAHVHWAAHLTAWTRIRLHEKLVERDRGAGAVYCDTDSVFAESPRTESPGLGGWESEGPYQRFRALAPKVYRFERDYRTIVKGKGLPELTPELWETFAAGGPVPIDRGVHGLKSAAKRGGLFQRKGSQRINRADGVSFGGRIRVPGENWTRARSWGEILRWERDS